MRGLVIPCYNEEHRLVTSEIETLLSQIPDLTVCLVNDGSTDRTAEVLDQFAARVDRVVTLHLKPNGGKAEAVRRGLLHLIDQHATWVGYADADFSTPAEELIRLFAMTDQTRAHALLGSRVKLLGLDIERKPLRHYLGRVFATLASLALELPVYDTQCGAKLFRNDGDFQKCVAQRFDSRWAFDVELIGRLNLLRPHATHQTFTEVPLGRWRDVSGSKLGPAAMLKAGMDVLRIGWNLRRQRRARS